jgi:AraC-like DNA-binding protein/quercetin dioxygenase-like cupin family protein
MANDLHRKYLDFHNTDRAVVAMEINWPDGASTGWHSHPRGQLLYAIEGIMIVSSAAGSWVVPPNRAVWLTAGIEHEVRMFGEVKIRTVFIDAKEVRKVPNETCVIQVSALLRELIVAVAKMAPGYVRGSRDDLLMRLMIEELKISDVLPLHLPVPGNPRVKLICEALTNNPADVSTVSHWAKRLSVSPKTIHRLFLQETGLSFAQWREQARLLLALRRIASGDRIIDVAFDCGYASQSAFAAMFRRHFGTSPSNFYR